MTTSTLKTLKFEANLVPLVLSGEKDTTWRLWDDKDIKEGDRVTLVARPELNNFAEAIIVSVREKPMGALTDFDKKGHEKFKNNQEMFETYSRYYKKPVNQETLVKIVRFKLLKIL
jgi:hypothetical protein